MASKGNVKPKKPSVSAAPAIQRLVAKTATLSYKPRQASGEAPVIINLDSVGANDRDGNVGPVVFDNSITITQKTKEGLCSFKLGPADYKFESIMPGERVMQDPVTVQVQVVNAPTCDFDSPREEKAPGVAQAKDFPLAKASSTFDCIYLQIGLRAFEGTPKPANIRVGQLKRLMTGKETLDQESPWARRLNGDIMAMHSESEAQRKQLGLFKGCRIVTHPGPKGGDVVVEVFPGKPQNAETPAEAKDFDFESKKVGMSYFICDSTRLFPEDEDLYPEFPIFGLPFTDGWELSITTKIKGYDAPIVGMIRNSMAGKDLSRFFGEESGITLEPIHNDVLGDRARRAIGDTKIEIDAWAAQAKGFLGEDAGKTDLATPPSLLNPRTLFSDDKCKHDENELPRESPIPDEFRSELNTSQGNALEMALTNKVSIVWGAPGTGKSWVDGYLIEYLRRNAAERMVCCAMANVAVDAMLATALKVFDRFSPREQAPFARIYSESQILAQWAADQQDLLNSPNHIESLRYQEALRNPEQWEAYLEGREVLATKGSFRNKEEYKAYTKCLRPLSKQTLLNGIRAIFCTIASCQSSVVYHLDRMTGKVEWVYPATTGILDEAGIPSRPQVMIPMMTFRAMARLVLSGDPFQLHALFLSKDAEKWFPACFLQDLVDRHYPHTFLNVQYRMHDVLYGHLVSIVYKKAIDSYYKTTNPSGYLRDLMARMPLRVMVDEDVYTLTSYMHFLDVPHGIMKSSGSSWNDEEVKVASGLVQELLRSGIPRNTITVMTGYTAQKAKLREMAQVDGWSDIAQPGLTIDSSQGSEWRIVILTLVSVEQVVSFMGKRARANVGTSRQMEAFYLIGNGPYWFSQAGVGFKFMHLILKDMRDKAEATGRPSFIVTPPRFAELAASYSAPATRSGPRPTTSQTSALPASPVAASAPVLELDHLKGKHTDEQEMQEFEKSVAEQWEIRRAHREARIKRHEAVGERLVAELDEEDRALEATIATERKEKLEGLQLAKLTLDEW